MSTLAAALPTSRLVSADLLKLRRRRGLVAVTALLTIGAMVILYGVIEVLHLVNPGKYGPAGGVANLGHGASLAGGLGAVAAAIIGSTAAVGDLDAGVYRDLVVTGRSRLALYLSRLPSGLAFVLAFVVAGYALAAVVTVAFAGGRAAPGIGLLLTTGLWVVLQVAFYYLLAVAVACLLGSRSYAIGVLLAWALAVAPLLGAISALGVVRELVPDVAIQNLMPVALEHATDQPPQIGMSLAAIVVVIVGWTLAAQLAGAWRDTTRDA
jgi:ABC-type transport system involved in multi-copper enzyme maturation permease subunit